MLNSENIHNYVFVYIRKPLNRQTTINMLFSERNKGYRIHPWSDKDYQGFVDYDKDLKGHDLYIFKLVFVW